MAMAGWEDNKLMSEGERQEGPVEGVAACGDDGLQVEGGGGEHQKEGQHVIRVTALHCTKLH
jgi:hypothetical protein